MYIDNLRLVHIITRLTKVFQQAYVPITIISVLRDFTACYVAQLRSSNYSLLLGKSTLSNVNLFDVLLL